MEVLFFGNFLSFTQKPFFVIRYYIFALMKKWLISVCCLFACLLQAQEQYDNLVGKSYAERKDAIRELHWVILDNHIDWDSASEILEDLRASAKRHNDLELRFEADLIEAWYDYSFQSRKPDKLKAVQKEAEEKGVITINCRTVYLTALHYWYARQYEQAFYWFLHLDDLLQSLDLDIMPDMGNMYMEIGNAYYHFGDYRPAITYFEKVTQLPIIESDIHSWRHAWNTMGLAYRKTNNFESSDNCFRILIEQAEKDRKDWGDFPLIDERTDKISAAGLSEQWSGIASGNLANNHYLREEYEEAVRLYEYDIYVAEKYDVKGLVLRASISLADIYTGYGRLPLAKSYIDRANQYIQELDETDPLVNLYPVMSKWYMASGDARQASRYLDSALVAKERFSQKFSSLQLMRAKQEITANQREAEIMKLQAESVRQIGKRNLYLSGLVILVLIAVFLVYRQRKINELRIKERDIKLLAADKELQEARRHLETFARTVSENNRKLEELSKSGVPADSELIQQLANQTILTDADWERFSELFGKVYPGFQYRLKSGYPQLTPAEIRCLSMEKLCFSNKEMATMQGISPNSVMVTKHRIRKKLNLDKDTTLTDFVSGV